MNENQSNANWLNIYAVILQLVDLAMLAGDTSNQTLLRELQNQNEKYLSKIIEQNESILEKLQQH